MVQSYKKMNRRQILICYVSEVCCFLVYYQDK